MNNPGDDVVDMSKLTERELLILLHRDVQQIKKEIAPIPNLKDRVLRIETKIYMIGAGIGGVSIVFTIIVNAFKLFE